MNKKTKPKYGQIKKHEKGQEGRMERKRKEMNETSFELLDTAST